MTNNTIFPGNVGIGTNSPLAPLHIGGTDAICVPSGTTAQRPTGTATELTGSIRYNTDTYRYEGHGEGDWINLSDSNPPDPIISQPATANRLSWAKPNLIWNVYDLSGGSLSNQTTMPTPTGVRAPVASESPYGYPGSSYADTTTPDNYGRWYLFNGSSYTDLGRRS